MSPQSHCYPPRPFITWKYRSIINIHRTSYTHCHSMPFPTMQSVAAATASASTTTRLFHRIMAGGNRNNPRGNTTPLEEEERWLEECPLDVNGMDDNGNTPLCFVRRERTIRYLVRKGANVNHRGHWGNSPSTGPVINCKWTSYGFCWNAEPIPIVSMIAGMRHCILLWNPVSYSQTPPPTTTTTQRPPLPTGWKTSSHPSFDYWYNTGHVETLGIGGMKHRSWSIFKVSLPAPT